MLYLYIIFLLNSCLWRAHCFRHRSIECLNIQISLCVPLQKPEIFSRHLYVYFLANSGLLRPSSLAISSLLRECLYNSSTFWQCSPKWSRMSSMIFCRSACRAMCSGVSLTRESYSTGRVCGFILQWRLNQYCLAMPRNKFLSCFHPKSAFRGCSGRKESGPRGTHLLQRAHRHPRCWHGEAPIPATRSGGTGKRTALLVAERCRANAASTAHRCTRLAVLLFYLWLVGATAEKYPQACYFFVLGRVNGKCKVFWGSQKI